MQHHKTILGIFITVIVTAIIVPLATPAEKIQYQLNLKPGKLYYFKTLTEQNVSQIIEGQEQLTQATVGIGYDLNIREIDRNGNIWIELTYRWASLNLKSPQEEIAYDSAGTNFEIPPAAQVLNALVSKGFYLQMTPQGRISRINGLNMMISQIKANIPEGPAKKSLLATLEQRFDEKLIKQPIENIIAIYPDNPVTIGDSWNKTAETYENFPAIMDIKWTLKERSNNIAVIDVNSTVRPNPTPDTAITGNIKYNLTGNQYGRIEMDELTGLIAKSTQNLNLTGTMIIPTGKAPAEKISIPVKMTSNMTLEITEQKKDTSQQTIAEKQ